MRRAHRLVPVGAHIVEVDEPTRPVKTGGRYSRYDSPPLMGNVLCTGERVELRAVPKGRGTAGGAAAPCADCAAAAATIKKEAS